MPAGIIVCHRVSPATTGPAIAGRSVVAIGGGFGHYNFSLWRRPDDSL